MNATHISPGDILSSSQAHIQVAYLDYLDYLNFSPV